jgi:WD40 repeat protein
MAVKNTKKEVGKTKGGGEMEAENLLQNKKNPNKLHEKGQYAPPGELMFNFKKVLRKPQDIPAKGASKQNQSQPDKPKISEIAWGNHRYPTQLVSIDDSGKLIHWDAASGKILTTIEASKTWLNSVDFERTEGKKVACGSLDAKILIFEINIPVKKKEKDINKNKPIHELVGHTGAVQCCRFLNGNFLISGSTDSTVCVWDLESPQRYIHTI